MGGEELHGKRGIFRTRGRVLHASKRKSDNINCASVDQIRQSGRKMAASMFPFADLKSDHPCYHRALQQTRVTFGCLGRVVLLVSSGIRRCQQQCCEIIRQGMTLGQQILSPCYVLLLKPSSAVLILIRQVVPYLAFHHVVSSTPGSFTPSETAVNTNRWDRLAAICSICVASDGSRLSMRPSRFGCVTLS